MAGERGGYQEAKLKNTIKQSEVPHYMFILLKTLNLDLQSSMYFISKSDYNDWIVDERRETAVNVFCVLTVLIVKPSEIKREE